MSLNGLIRLGWAAAGTVGHGDVDRCCRLDGGGIASPAVRQKIPIVSLCALLAGCTYLLPQRIPPSRAVSAAPPTYAASDLAALPSLLGDRTLVPGIFDVPPEIVRFVAPEYPLDLRAAETEGQATIDMLVGTDGSVKKVAVRSATHRAFGEAAAEAVSQWRFRPITVDGQAVEVYLIQPLSFRLKD